MDKKGRLSAVGGDERQLYIARELEASGFDVDIFGIDGSRDTVWSIVEAMKNADYLLLPIPLTRDGYRLNCSQDVLLMDLLDMIPKETTVLAGKMPPFFADHLSAKGIAFSDYYEDKEYIMRNAEITAEGAVSMLRNESKRTVDEMRILVCGYGRIGKSLVKKLTALGAFVTVAARKKEALLEAKLCFSADTDMIDYTRDGIFDTCKKYDVIFNTVPSRLFDETCACVLENSIYFELAGPPYGGSAEFIRSKAGKFILASGIPGKYAPESAGKAAYEAISRCLFTEAKI